jgi:hypothetical protein
MIHPAESAVRRRRKPENRRMSSNKMRNCSDS